MFFIVSKILEAFFQPLNAVLIVGLVGLALLFMKRRRVGLTMVSAALLTLAVIAWSPLPSLMVRVLEDRFPRPPADMPAPTGIIVLGGAMNEDIDAARGEPTLSEAASRLTTGVALALRYPNARLVFTGGSSDLRQSGLDEARGVRRLWLSLGVPESRMTFEDDSRNTYENATMTRALVSPKPGERWLLVTSATHMPRSVGIFRKVGWNVVPYPVDYRTLGDDRDFKPSMAAMESLQKFSAAGHEWIGLVAYWLTHKTNALFPAP